MNLKMTTRIKKTKKKNLSWKSSDSKSKGSKRENPLTDRLHSLNSKQMKESSMKSRSSTTDKNSKTKKQMSKNSLNCATTPKRILTW